MLLLSVLRTIAEEARAKRLRTLVNATKAAVPVDEVAQAGICNTQSASAALPFSRGL